jgi:hypothetical protein
MHQAGQVQCGYFFICLSCDVNKRKRKLPADKQGIYFLHGNTTGQYLKKKLADAFKNPATVKDISEQKKTAVPLK